MPTGEPPLIRAAASAVQACAGPSRGRDVAEQGFVQDLLRDEPRPAQPERVLPLPEEPPRRRRSCGQSPPSRCRARELAAVGPGTPGPGRRPAESPAAEPRRAARTSPSRAPAPAAAGVGRRPATPRAAGRGAGPRPAPSRPAAPASPEPEPPRRRGARRRRRRRRPRRQRRGPIGVPKPRSPVDAAFARGRRRAQPAARRPGRARADDGDHAERPPRATPTGRGNPRAGRSCAPSRARRRLAPAFASSSPPCVSRTMRGAPGPAWSSGSARSWPATSRSTSVPRR